MPLFSHLSPEKRKKLLYGVVALVFVALVTLGAFAGMAGCHRRMQ